MAVAVLPFFFANFSLLMPDMHKKSEGDFSLHLHGAVVVEQPICEPPALSRHDLEV